MTRPLVLASTSPYRAGLLRRLTTDFKQDRPDVEESPLPGESPRELSVRLAAAKARALAGKYPAHLILGSDQVVDFEGEILGKPGHHDGAVRQLSRFSGRSVLFHTALAVYDSAADVLREQVVSTRVRFRDLSKDLIEAYLLRERPYDCAGSFKCEGLGIALFHGIESEDPTALVGLPLIALTEMLGVERVLRGE